MGPAQGRLLSQMMEMAQIPAPVVSAPQGNPVENSQDLTNQKTVRRFRTLRDIDLPHFNGKLNNTGFIDKIMSKSQLSINKKPELSRDLLRMTLDLLDIELIQNIGIY